MSNDNDGHQAQPVDQPSTDLNYLHPDNLRIGVFAGDWVRTGDRARIPVGFVGTLIDCSDRAVLCSCTREVAEAVSPGAGTCASTANPIAASTSAATRSGRLATACW